MRKAYSKFDYHSFGMQLTGRTYSAVTGYRYGFNGKENDNDVKGEGNQQDYGMRIYDPRLGRFLSVDPLASTYPFYSPYHYAGNSPIANIDLDGGEPKWMIDANGKLTKPMIALYAAAFNYKASRIAHITLMHGDGTAYMAQTQYGRMIYNPQCMNYCEKTNYQEYLNMWFNVSAHEFGHRDQQGDSKFYYYLWSAMYGVSNFTTALHNGEFLIGLAHFKLDVYSQKSPLEVPCYAIESEVIKLINLDGGAALKILESESIGETDKVDALTYLGAKYQAAAANDKLKAYRQQAAANGKISKREQRTIKRLRNAATAMQNKANSLKTSSVENTLSQVNSTTDRSIKEMDQDAYDANKAKVKEAQKKD